MITITDIILMILIFSVLYLLYFPDVENFIDETDINNAIDQEINNRYMVNLNNMRILNNFILSLSNKDQINISQDKVKLYDLKTNNMNINANLNVSKQSLFGSDLNIKGTFSPDIDKLKIPNKIITNTVTINQGQFNDIFPKNSILMFSIKDKNYNIPYGWVPCDGSYYDVIQTYADKFGKDENGDYVKFYKKTTNQPEERNVDLAYTWNTYDPTIEQLVKLRDIGLDKYYTMTGVQNDPFSSKDLEALSFWDASIKGKETIYTGFFMRNIAISHYKSPKKGLVSDPIKRDYIYIRKII